MIEWSRPMEPNRARYKGSFVLETKARSASSTGWCVQHLGTWRPKPAKLRDLDGSEEPKAPSGAAVPFIDGVREVGEAVDGATVAASLAEAEVADAVEARSSVRSR